MSRTSLFLEILQVATRKGTHHRLFCGDNFICKNFKYLSLVEALLIKTQDCSLPPTTLLNFSQISSWRSIEIVAPKTLEKCYMKWGSLLTTTTNSTTECSEKKKRSKIRKIPEKSLQGCSFFYHVTGLQSATFDRLPEKWFAVSILK